MAKVRTTLHHFRQGKRLLTGIALHLLRVRVIFFNCSNCSGSLCNTETIGSSFAS